MAQRIDAEAEPPRELFLCHAKLNPDRFHVRDMYAIHLRVGLSLCVGHRLFETPRLRAADDASVARDVAPSGTPVIRHLTVYVL